MAPKTPSVDITVVTKNLRALHGALEHSLTIQRARVQEIVDDLVARGTLTRTDADRLITQLLASSKDYSQALLQVLDSVTAQTRKSIGAGIEPVMATAGKAAGMVAETVRKAPGLPAKKPRSTSRSAKTAPKAATKSASKSATKAAPKAAQKSSAKPATDVVPNEPIPGYSRLTVAEIKPRLTGLSAGALRKVRDLEMAGKARKSVLAELEQRLKSTRG